MNHVMYANAICLMVSSYAFVPELINFSVQNDLFFNSSKSYCTCMMFKLKSYKLSCPII